MATNLSGPPEPNVSALPSDNVADDVVILSERTVPILVRGIIADAQHLIGQQLSMFRQEIRDDVRKGKQVILILVVGVGITVGANVLLLLMLPLLLNWAVPVLPLWTCFGIIGGVLAPVGGILLYLGVRKIESFDLLSNQAVEAFKESMTWKTKAT
jgi:hypothetical protein